MSAVIRLKRRVDEDPLNAFVLNCKRQRTEPDQQQQQDVAANGSDASGETSTVLKFAGTFTRADNIPAHLQQRLSKEDAKDAISRVHRPTIASRNRLASRQTAQNSRFRIVNCTRSLSQVEGGEEAATTIVDVERDLLAPVTSAAAVDKPTEQHATANTQEEEPGFVYDLYVVDESQHQAHVPYIPDNLDDISVAIFEDPLYSGHRGLGGDRSDSMGEESEDSNDENNWRNDYPDEDEGDAESIGDEDMRRAVEEFDLDGDRELSSDEDYYEGGDRNGGGRPADAHFYDTDSDDDDSSDEALNKKDVVMFGKSYARYKARILKEMRSDDESDGGRSSSASGCSDQENFDLYD